MEGISINEVGGDDDEDDDIDEDDDELMEAALNVRGRSKGKKENDTSYNNNNINRGLSKMSQPLPVIHENE